jgi:glycosyltransferase involved in cell wall biosynthesis
MKVGFDISQLAHAGGVGIYTKELTSQLEQISDLEMTFFYTSLRKKYQGDLKNVRSFKIPPTIAEKLFHDFRKISMERFLGPIDVYHSSDWIQPPTKAKTVTTYHDVIPLKYPEWSHPKIVQVHQKRLHLVEQEIDQVIAVSETTKQDLCQISNIPEHQVTVIYEGVGDQFKLLDEDVVSAFKRKYNLPDKFALGIGGIGNRRNLERAKEACGEVPFIVTGSSLPRLSDEEMVLLYNAATLLLYPSLYEGFGLPIIEAMACGTPVITSNLSSMKEIAGENALLVDPISTQSIHQAITDILSDPKVLQEFSKKGIQHAKHFSWQKAAVETAEVYKKLCQ